MLLRLWVPLTHRLVARNWNFASSGLALTASSVANRVGVSTPLRGGRVLLVAVVMVISSHPPCHARHGAGTGGDRTTLGDGVSPGVPLASPRPAGRRSKR